MPTKLAYEGALSLVLEEEEDLVSGKAPGISKEIQKTEKEEPLD